MNDDDKDFMKLVIGIVVVILVIISIPIYAYSHVWGEQGTISWVGQKAFSDNGGYEVFVIPFAVTVPIHGTFNFTASDHSSICGNANYSASQSFFLKNGTVIGLVKLQCGGFDLVIDP